MNTDIYKTIDFAFYGSKELTTKESDSQQDEDVETAAFSLALMRQGMFRDPGAFGRLISANMPVCVFVNSMLSTFVDIECCLYVNRLVLSSLLSTLSVLMQCLCSL